MRVRLPPSAPKAKRERAAKRKFKSEADASAPTNDARLSPQTPSSRGDVVRCRVGWRRQRAGAGISRSNGPSPLAVPECFDRILATTTAIEDRSSTRCLTLRCPAARFLVIYRDPNSP